MTSFTPIPFLQFVEFAPELCLSTKNPEENLQKLFTLSICCNKIFLCPRLDRIISNSIMEFCENILNIDSFNKREWKTKYYPGWYCQDVITNVSQGGRWQYISGVMGKIQIPTLQKKFRTIICSKIVITQSMMQSFIESIIGKGGSVHNVTISKFPQIKNVSVPSLSDDCWDDLIAAARVN